MPRIRLLFVGLLQRWPGFDLEPSHVGCVLDKAAVGQNFLQVLPFFPAIIFPPIFHTHLHNKKQSKRSKLHVNQRSL
jgi:hypothetical protein